MENYEKNYWNPYYNPDEYEAKRWLRAHQRVKARKMRTQKIMGVIMIAMNFILPTGAMFLLVPLGLDLLFNKEQIIY